MVHPAGFEPATPWFEAKYSNPLSYGCKYAVYYSNREGKVITVTPISSFAEASRYLSRFYQNTRDNYTLDNMRTLMDYLGNPQEKFRTVHVAGTSGKTSTVYYMSALLAAAGKKVGLTVSPHVDQINERAQINNMPLPEAQFCDALTEFLGLVETGPVEPSWFETMVAFAYWYFAKAEVDYVVSEVGLGGLMDGTNVIRRRDKVCVITDIGFDHMNILGETLPEIASQKIGIVQPGNQVFTYKQPDEVMTAFKDWTESREAVLNVVEEPGPANGIPAFQARNWNLAYAAYNYVSNRDRLEHLTSKVLRQTWLIQVPGRMDIRQAGGKTLIMDGAHNAQKMTAFLDSFRKLYPDAKPAILMSLKNGKEYEELIPLLKPIASRFILTSFESKQDVVSRSMDINVLLKAFQEAGIDAMSVPDQRQAYEQLISGPEDIFLITGSFYLLSQIRNNEHLV